MALCFEGRQSAIEITEPERVGRLQSNVGTLLEPHSHEMNREEKKWYLKENLLAGKMPKQWLAELTTDYSSDMVTRG